MKNFRLYIVILLVGISCSPPKESPSKARIRELRARVAVLEEMMNDTDKDGIPDYLDVENNSLAGFAVDTKGRMVDLNGNGVADEIERYLEQNIRTGSSSPINEMALPAQFYYTNLSPSVLTYRSKFFKMGSTIGQCAVKLEYVLRSKMKLEEGDYKFFNLENDGFGVITQKQCLDPKATTYLRPHLDCDKLSVCPMYNIFCVSKGYWHFYIFLITKKPVKDKIKYQDETITRYYQEDELSSNWRAIPELRQLFENKNKKFTDEYSFAIKVMVVSKKRYEDEAKLIDPTYDTKKYLNYLFTNSR